MRRETGFFASAVLLFAALAGSVALLQPGLANELHAIKDSDDVYPFPPPPVLRLATLGYVAATIDVLWGKLLIENGTHWTEHRPFPDMEHYLDAVIELDPTFRPFYEYVDSLLCYRPMNGHEKDAREARAYLERGTRELPTDPDVWRKYGQFVAFMGPSFLASDEERQAWRRDGAIALQHAVDLGADVDLGIAASAVLESRFGEKEAAISFLEHAYALTEDPKTRSDILLRLQYYHASEAADRQRAMASIVEHGWGASYPFLDRTTYMLIAPVADPARCVGLASSQEHGCERDWDELRPR